MSVLTRKNRAGFTLLELLVAIGVFAVLIGLTARPVSEVVSSIVATRRTAVTAAQNIAFIDLLGRDIRTAAWIDDATSERIVAADAKGDSIIWTFTERTATRGATIMPINVKHLVLAPDRQAPSTRHILLRGDFAGIGPIEQGFAIRRERR